MQIFNIQTIFMKCYFLFHQNFDKLLCNLLLSLNPRSFSFLPCNNIYLDPLLCLLNHCLLFSKTHLSSCRVINCKTSQNSEEDRGQKVLSGCLFVTHETCQMCSVCVYTIICKNFFNQKVLHWGICHTLIKFRKYRINWDASKYETHDLNKFRKYHINCDLSKCHSKMWMIESVVASIFFCKVGHWIWFTLPCMCSKY